MTSSQLIEALVRETSADLRVRGQNIWNVAQFFTALEASLLTVGFALLVGTVPSTGLMGGAAAAISISIVSFSLGLLGVYTFYFEGFHWARARVVRKRILRAAIAELTADERAALPEGLDVDLEVFVSRGSSPKSIREFFEAEAATKAIAPHPASAATEYLEMLGDETTPTKGTRYALRWTLVLLTVAAAVLLLVASYWLGTLLWGPGLYSSASLATAILVIMFGYGTLGRSLSTQGF